MDAIFFVKIYLPSKVLICSQVPHWNLLHNKRPNCLKPEGALLITTKNFHFLKHSLNLIYICKIQALQSPVRATESETSLTTPLMWPGHHFHLCHQYDDDFQSSTVRNVAHDIIHHHHHQERSTTNCLHSFCLPLWHRALSKVGMISLITRIMATVVATDHNDNCERKSDSKLKEFCSSPNLIPTFLEMIRKNGPQLQKNK